MRQAFGTLMLLLAVLLMPFGMSPAVAAGSHHADSAAMAMGHCPDRQQHGDMKGGIAECTMACAAALPAGNPAQAGPLTIVCEPAAPARAERLPGIHPDTATPPPKHS
jgi:hypothetical protein